MQGDGRSLEDDRFYVQINGNKLVPIDQWLKDLAEVMKEWKYEDTSKWEKYEHQKDD
jgi:hypothetical protein